MVALLRRALALLPSGDSAIRARLEGFLAQEAFSSVPDRERRAMVGRALAMARRVGDPKALASVLTSHSWIVAGPESLPERLALADELVAVGREAGLPYAECDGQQVRFLAFVELGDIEAADDTLAAAHSAARTDRAQGTVALPRRGEGAARRSTWTTRRRKPCGPARRRARRRSRRRSPSPRSSADVRASASSRDA